MKKSLPLEAQVLTARAGVAASLLLWLAPWPQTGYSAPGLNQAVHSAPPLRSGTHKTAAEPGCSYPRGAEVSDEDRLLVAGGKRAFTGRSQRMGGSYVAEAISHSSAGCAYATVQLYLFRDGHFVGAATPYSLAVKQARFEHFSLVDPEHLRYVIADSTAGDSLCLRLHSRHPEATTTLVKAANGWTVRMDFNASVSYQLRQPLRYPRDAQGHFNEGTVLMHVTVDRNGFPTNVTINRGSSHPELDQRAIASLRGECFDPAKPSVDIPIRFSITHL